MTAGILMSLPIAMLGMLTFVNPDYEMVLFHDPMARKSWESRRDCNSLARSSCGGS